MKNQSSKPALGIATSASSNHPIYSQEGKKAGRNIKNVTLLVLGCISFLILLTGSAYYLGFQKSKSQVKNDSNSSTPLQSSESEIIENNRELLSPVDNKKLEYNSRLTVGLYIGGIPVDVFFEQYGDSSEGRIAVYHAWNKLTNRNEGAFVVDEEDQGPCLRKLLPITKSDGMRFITEYICGDSQQIKITSFSFKPEQNIKEVKVENLHKFNLLNDYFSSVYLKSFVKVIGWQDFDHLLVDQISYPEEQQGSTSKEKHEIYLFGVSDKNKQLIHTIE